MQPTYLPWAGYFNMIARVDEFVFLDDVRMAPRSWQQRNRILLKGEAAWLTVPVAGGRDQRLCDVVVDDTRHWRRKHQLTIQHVYSGHPFFADVIEPVASILGSDERHLAEINIALIRWFAKLFGLKTRIHQSSNMPVSGGKSERLLNICHALGATAFLSARGSREYIEAEGVFALARFPVRYHDYEPGAYEQLHSPGRFISHLSIIDVIANMGVANTIDYVKD